MSSKYVAHLLASLQYIQYSGKTFSFLMIDISAATLLKYNVTVKAYSLQLQTNLALSTQNDWVFGKDNKLSHSATIVVRLIMFIGVTKSTVLRKPLFSIFKFFLPVVLEIIIFFKTYILLFKDGTNKLSRNSVNNNP